MDNTPANPPKKEFSDIERWLTPSEEDQALLVLQGKCPHNQGWKFSCFGHNDTAYDCVLCGHTEWY